MWANVYFKDFKMVSQDVKDTSGECKISNSFDCLYILYVLVNLYYPENKI